MADASNVRIGACTVTFRGTDLGHTLGGVTFNYEPDYEDLRVDKWAGPIDKALTSENLTITVRLAEPQVQRLRYAIAAATYDSSGANSSLELGKSTGFLGSSVAGHLRLHPQRLTNTDQSEDINIFKAVPVDEVELEYTVDDQLVAEVTFQALVDETKSDGTVLGHIGPGVS